MALKNGRTTAALQTILVGSVIPSGTISPFGGGTVPSGWLLCDGTAVSRTTYASLYAAILVANGYGDNATTFNLPDLRGRFLRGVDGTAGNDPDKTGRTAMATGGNTGNLVGSVQGHAVQGHGHDFYIGDTSASFSHLRTQNQIALADNAGNRYLQSGQSGSQDQIQNAKTLTGSGTIQTSTESRPQNANVNYIIKV